MQRALVLNGPNLDLLGVREPHIYGTTTLSQLDDLVRKWGAELGVEVEVFQANSEGALIEHIHDARSRVDGLVINAGALTHYARGLQDAIAAVSLPTVEVHISNVKEREAFRRESLITPPAVYAIYGRGLPGYRWALRHLVHRSAMPFARVPYGTFPDQFGDLRMPTGDRRTLVVVIHGGLWAHEWTRDATEGIAVDLTRQGHVTWNLEYRRVGLGGGWPESFDDVRSALEAAQGVSGIGPERTVILGHSAGATMALWAGRADTAPAPKLVLGLAAIPDLVRAEQEDLGAGSVRRLLGRRRPHPTEYSPFHRLPTGTGTVLVAADDDTLVPSAHGRDYAATARTKGDQLDLIEVGGRHSDFLDPGKPAWKEVAGILAERFPS